MTLPDRINISIPPDSDLDVDDIDNAVEQSEYASRSAFVRAAIRGEVSLDEL